MINIIFRSSFFSIHSKYLLPSYRNYLTDLSQYTNSLSHPYIQQNNRRFSIVFFPNYFSQQNEKKFCWEWFFILLRMIYQPTDNKSQLFYMYPSYMKPGHKKLSGLHHFFHIKILIYPDTRCVNAWKLFKIRL